MSGAVLSSEQVELRMAAVRRLDQLAAEMRALAEHLRGAASSANFAAGSLAAAARQGWTMAQCALLHADARLPCDHMLMAIADGKTAAASPGLAQLSYSTLQAAQRRMAGRLPAPAPILREASR